MKRLQEEQLSSKLFQAETGLDSLHVEIMHGSKSLVTTRVTQGLG